MTDQICQFQHLSVTSWWPQYNKKTNNIRRPTKQISHTDQLFFLSSTSQLFYASRRRDSSACGIPALPKVITFCIYTHHLTFWRTTIPIPVPSPYDVLDTTPTAILHTLWHTAPLHMTGIYYSPCRLVLPDCLWCLLIVDGDVIGFGSSWDVGEAGWCMGVVYERPD